MSLETEISPIPDGTSLAPQGASRRGWLQQVGAAALVGLAATQPAASRAEESAVAEAPFQYCLNTSTIRGQELGIDREVEIAAEAGYQGIEPWINELEKYEQQGGSLKDLGKKISDLGLKVPSAIGFAQWIVDDDAARKNGLDQARRDMDRLVQIGGQRIAAPPVGAHQSPGPALPVIAERFKALIQLGRETGIRPQLEVWGFSQTLSKLAETLYVLAETHDKDILLLPDIYHLQKGGSGFESLKMLSGAFVEVFHVNDYPAQPDLSKLNDADRVYPGDGAAPLDEIFRTLSANGFRGMLSLELFNRDYWKQDAMQVAKTGLEKTRAAVQHSLEKK